MSETSRELKRFSPGPLRMIKESNILTLAICLSGWREEYEWRRTVEIPASASLHDLHGAIQNIVRFDDDHMYTFYVGRHWRQTNSELADPASPLGGSGYEEILLREVYPLEKKCKLYYWFDFGDDWIFEIRSKPGAKMRNARAKYPRVVEKLGRNPKQYGA